VRHAGRHNGADLLEPERGADALEQPRAAAEEERHDVQLEFVDEPCRFRRLPVVEHGRLVGMVAQADIALKDNERTGDLVGAISEPSEEERR
jgi:hypothetical protein